MTSLLYALCLSACVSAPPRPNILLVIMDDVGTDKLAMYGGPDPAYTPTLDALAAAGQRYMAFWAAPTCSPCRAQLQTGRYGYHWSVGRPANPETDPWELPDEAVTLAEALAPCGYTAAMIGKWHLGPAWDGPLKQGYGRYVGTRYNIPDYYAWPRRDASGNVSTCTVYATLQQTDDALDFIAAAPQPWLCVVAYSAPHLPYHWPPGWSPDPYGDGHAKCNAAMAYMDGQIERLIAACPADTVAFVLGDNGSQGSSTVPPTDPTRVKNTVYEGGLATPLIVWSGAGRVSPGVCERLVHVVDLYATILALGGRPAAARSPLGGPPPSPACDGRSFASLLRDPAGPPVRDWMLAEAFDPNGAGAWLTRHDWAVRDRRWKLIQRLDSPPEFYDLLVDPWESLNLYGSQLDPEQQAALERLQALSQHHHP